MKIEMMQCDQLLCLWLSQPFTEHIVNFSKNSFETRGNVRYEKGFHCNGGSRGPEDDSYQGLEPSIPQNFENASMMIDRPLICIYMKG